MPVIGYSLTGADAFVGYRVCCEQKTTGIYPDDDFVFFVSEIEMRDKRLKRLIYEGKSMLQFNQQLVKYITKDMLLIDASSSAYKGKLGLEIKQSIQKNQHIDVNLKAPAYLTKEFSKNVKGKNNNIINIIDQRVFKLTPFFFSYTLSKTGLYTLTKTSAMELAPNIRVNGIAPGPTIKNKRQSDKHFKKQYLATPLKQQVNVQDICSAVDFFIKNSSITGQVIAIDSGQSLNWQTPDVIGKE